MTPSEYRFGENKETDKKILDLHNAYRVHSDNWGTKREVEAICKETGFEKKTVKQILRDMKKPQGKEYCAQLEIEGFGKREFNRIVKELVQKYSWDKVGRINVKAVKELREKTGVSFEVALDAVYLKATGYTYRQLQEVNRAKTKEQRRIQRVQRQKSYEESGDVLQGACSGGVRCPSCHSANIGYQERVSVGRALVGGAVGGAKGALLGGLTGGKFYAVCLNCGKSWKV